MAETESTSDENEIGADIKAKIEKLFALLKIEKVFFIDDLVNHNLTKENFIGLTQSILADGKIADLRSINIQNAIDFTKDEQILIDHISEVWDSIRPGKQKSYFEKLYTIAGTPDIIKDFKACVGLAEFFQGTQIEFLNPNAWDEKRDILLGQIENGKQAIVIFDQDLSKAQGRFEQGTQGEQLILELKQLNISNKVIIALLTHTVTSYDQELPRRREICRRIPALSIIDFFVLAKSRLDKFEVFGDGLKKVLLNTYCEQVKYKTIEIIKAAQTTTIEELQKLDTYDFDYTVFKTSNTEGVWEPETLLRITDVIFRDAVRAQMLQSDYVSSMNKNICSAKEIANVEFKVENPGEPYKTRFKLRNQEIYEPGEYLNGLRKPIDNGDIFIVTDGELKDKKFILVGQECDLMVRGKIEDKGERGARSATLLEIEDMSDLQLIAEISRKYNSEMKKKKFSNHFYADRFKLDYFKSGSNDLGLVHFSKAITADLNILDLIVFNEMGEAVLDLSAPTFKSEFHNFAWNSRYELISKEFKELAENLDAKYLAISGLENVATKNAIQADINRQFTFIRKAGIQVNYENNKFSFGLKRISRLRNPKAKHLLDRYYLHLARLAEQHDFAS